MLRPYPDRTGGDRREPAAAGASHVVQRQETLRAQIQEQRTRLAGLPPDTHEAEYCRRHIRFCEAQLRALDQSPAG